jgi:hypothetical protein
MVWAIGLMWRCWSRSRPTVADRALPYVVVLSKLLMRTGGAVGHGTSDSNNDTKATRLARSIGYWILAANCAARVAMRLPTKASDMEAQFHCRRMHQFAARVASGLYL